MSGYTTLKIFRSGEFSSDYSGPRLAGGWARGAGKEGMKRGREGGCSIAEWPGVSSPSAGEEAPEVKGHLHALCSSNKCRSAAFCKSFSLMSVMRVKILKPFRKKKQGL